MRWLILALFLTAFTPIYVNHDTPEKVDAEVKNLADNVQDEQFTVVNATPILSQMKDGQIVIMTTNTVVRLMFRQNQEIYSLNVSCVTVRR